MDCYNKCDKRLYVGWTQLDTIDASIILWIESADELLSLSITPS